MVMEKEDFPIRKPSRLKGYSYSQDGAYFITICAKDKANLFGTVVGGGVLDAPAVFLSSIGRAIDWQIRHMNERYATVQAEKYVVMPNHVHIILMIHDHGGSARAPENGRSGTPAPTENAAVPRWVSTFKRYCNRRCHADLFQRSFYDHIIRNEPDCRRVWEYIDTNPVKWREDELFTL